MRLFCLFFVFLTISRADEGMWLLTQLDKLPYVEMQKHGLELSPDQIYNPTGPSLVDAIVLLGGGTGSFISKDGLSQRSNSGNLSRRQPRGT